VPSRGVWDTRIVILGPPGSGKGTNARIISGIYGIPVITTGDMLRDAVASGTEKGRTAGEYMDRGELVPDDIVIGIVEERLARPDIARGFILDGFPRNLAQAEALDRILDDLGTGLTHVLNMVIDDEKIISRLVLRRSCPSCGAIYHLKNKPPRVDGVCDECCSELIQRSDDNAEVMKHRLEVYEEKSRPLLNRYRKQGLVRNLNGDMPIDVISEAVRRVLGDPKG
jgi:adenylate kinase